MPHLKTVILLWASVVAQLVQWSLPKPELLGSDPVIGKFYVLSTVFKRSKLKKNRPVECPIIKK